MTPQEIYDRMVGGVLKQGKPGIYQSTCMTITPDGCRCAAGFLIDDIEPKDAHFTVWRPDGTSGDHLTWSIDRAFRAANLQTGTTEMYIAEDLVGAHDSAAMGTCGWPQGTGDRPFIAAFRTRARAVAAQFGLNQAVLDTEPAS